MGGCGSSPPLECDPCCDQPPSSLVKHRPQLASGAKGRASPVKGRTAPVGLDFSPGFRLVTLTDERRPASWSKELAQLDSSCKPTRKPPALRVILLEAENAPSDSVLKFSSGSHSRESAVDIGKQLVIPSAVGRNGKMALTLFRCVASGFLPQGGESDAACEVPVGQSDGGYSCVRLHVRRDAAAYRARSTQEQIHCLFEDVLREHPQDAYRVVLEQLKAMRLRADAAGASLARVEAP